MPGRFAAALPEMRAESERRARRHEAERKQVRQERGRRRNPPTPDGDWLNIVQTAALLGVTANRVRQMARAGRIPATSAGERWWVRRLHAEQAARARAFARRMAARS